ncbi:hypothetical protein [Flavobacterium luteum]|uniref:hypothetical protein n=1 Tax=Flavobacterium luteum TaxID=2026654 RepID=UPI0017869A9B|nr:hypothetical protein [Flavobacterium luteum]
MKKVSLLSFYLIATVAIASSGNRNLLNSTHTQNPSLIAEKVSSIGGNSTAPATRPNP